MRMYSDRAVECSIYLEEVALLRKMYDSPYKRSRILTAWKTLRLSEEMGQESDKLEVDVFRDFVTKLSRL